MLAEHGGRTVRVRNLPIGIPYDRFELMAREAPSDLLTSKVKVRRSYGMIQRWTDDESLSMHMKVILGVDRLDYTKGLTNRLLAFQRLLDDHPEHKEKVMLLQVRSVTGKMQRLQFH